MLDPFASGAHQPAKSQLRRRASVAWAVLASIVAMGAFALWGGDRVAFQHGVQLESVSLGEQTYVGGLLPVTLRFRSHGPLPSDYIVLVHAESARGVDRGCSLSADHAPRVSTTQWREGQQIEHLVHLQIPAHCPRGVLHLHADDDRVYVGSSEIAASGNNEIET